MPLLWRYSELRTAGNWSRISLQGKILVRIDAQLRISKGISESRLALSKASEGSPSPDASRPPRHKQILSAILDRLRDRGFHVRIRARLPH